MIRLNEKGWLALVGCAGVGYLTTGGTAYGAVAGAVAFIVVFLVVDFLADC